MCETKVKITLNNVFLIVNNIFLKEKLSHKFGKLRNNGRINNYVDNVDKLECA